MVRGLLNLKNDVAVIALIEKNEDMAVIPFSQEELVLILPPDHRLAKRETVTFKEIAREQIIMKESGSGTRKLVNDMFEKRGLSPEILMETSNTEFIKQLVQRGEGVSFLVKAAVAMELEGTRLATVPLEGPRIFLDVSIVYLKHQPLQPPAEEFLKSLEKIHSEDMPSVGIGALMGKILSQPW